MSRISLLLFISLFFFINPAAAEADKYAGYEYKNGQLHQKTLAVVDNDCPKCEPIAGTYRSALRSLHMASYSREKLKVRLKQDKAHWKKTSATQSRPGSGGLSEEQERAAAQKLIAMIDLEEAYNKSIAKYDDVVNKLTNEVKVLEKQFEKCKSQCKAGAEEITDIRVGGDGTPYPINWNGIYPEVCEKCAKLAQTLNAYPEKIANRLHSIRWFEVFIRAKEFEIEKLKATFKPGIDPGFVNDIDEALVDGNSIGDFDYKPMFEKEVDEKHRISRLSRKFKRSKAEKAKEEKIKQEMGREKWARQWMDRAEAEIKDAEASIRHHEIKIGQLRKGFEVDLPAYNKCVKSCGGQTKKTACAFPDTKPPMISIGPKSEVGTTAEMTNKIKDQAKGAAMGALGNVLGGSGLGVGGIGSPVEGASKGPKEVKDPTKGAFTNMSGSGAEVGFRSTLNGNELTVSSEILDAPGNGTFHAQWLEDGQGNVYLPKKYLILELYQDWKLTVWWDYKRWKDGELVQHDHGEEVSFGRNTKRLAVWFEEKKNAIWSTLGFGTATKGVKGLGSVFELPASVLSSGCSLRLITHISQPDKDPVTTIPFVGEIPLDGYAPKGNKTPSAVNIPVGAVYSG